jgi:signal peptidase II
MKASLRIGIILLTLCACVGCDQVTKQIAHDHLLPGGTISLLNDTVRLEYTENPGAFLSLGQSLPEVVRHIVFIFGAIGVVCAVLVWALRAKGMSRARVVGAALMCGGALGNVIDRLTHAGSVVDFLNVGIGPVRTGIFNVADMVLIVGVGLMIYHSPRAPASKLPVQR